jgi:hypothetical protein
MKRKPAACANVAIRQKAAATVVKLDERIQALPEQKSSVRLEGPFVRLGVYPHSQDGNSSTRGTVSGYGVRANVSVLLGLL